LATLVLTKQSLPAFGLMMIRDPAILAYNAMHKGE